MNATEFRVLIPSTFTFTERETEKKIQVGNPDTNERMENGESATKEPRSYVFHVGEVRIRMIDTPSIGDSGGVEEDRKNIENILLYLSHYDEIHAVCILLKPNNSRHTTLFRYCIQEILVMLHSLLKDNIIFCFTNARATFYRPGDTLPALNKMLRDRNFGTLVTPHNYFCFDNEPFRILACVNNGVHFRQIDINPYAKSWDISIDETKRLLEYITTELKPHKVRETLSMNEARRIILAMSKPLTEVAKTIDHNLESAQRAKEHIHMYDADIKSLEQDLKFSGYDIKIIEMEHPRTVCTAPDCVRHVQVGIDRIENTLYKQICHNRCNCVNGIQTLLTNYPELRRCVCIERTSGNCRECGHHYTQHMHMTYDTKIVEKEYLSPEVMREIQKRGILKAQKDSAIQQIDRQIDQLKEEEKHIIRTSAKFGSFLKANAIIPYNDALGDYLFMCIAIEEKKPMKIRNDSLLFQMRKMKQEYERQKKVLDKAMLTGADEIVTTPAQVRQLQEELFQLKHFGPILKRLFDGISITNSARNKEFAEKNRTNSTNVHVGQEKSKGDEMAVSLKSLKSFSFYRQVTN